MISHLIFFCVACSRFGNGSRPAFLVTMEGMWIWHIASPWRDSLDSDMHTELVRNETMKAFLPLLRSSAWLLRGRCCTPEFCPTWIEESSPLRWLSDLDEGGLVGGYVKPRSCSRLREVMVIESLLVLTCWQDIPYVSGLQDGRLLNFGVQTWELKSYNWSSKYELNLRCLACILNNLVIITLAKENSGHEIWYSRLFGSSFKPLELDAGPECPPRLSTCSEQTCFENLGETAGAHSWLFWSDLWNHHIDTAPS